MSDCRSAVRDTNQGSLLQVRVTTGCDEARFPAGYDQWRNHIEVSVRAQPEAGKANRELLSIIARFFNLAADEIALAYGYTSREKGVLIRRPSETVINRINHGL
jgi:hypothetical protein